MKEILKKIEDSRKKKSLIWDIRRKLHSSFPIYFLGSKSIEFRNSSYKTYKKYEHKYRSLLNEGIIKHESSSSNKVWICWFQGIESAPPLVKACINSIKTNMPSKEIIILTDENISNYAKFPEYIIRKRKEGKISAAHYSDLLRAELLCEYGGMWIDATVLCTSNEIPKYINDSNLFVYKELDLVGLDVAPIVASSWFISAKSQQPILLMTRKLLYTYWNDHNYLENYFLFHIFFALATRKYKDDWKAVPIFNNNSPHVLQQELTNDFDNERWINIKQMSCFHKLNHHLDFSKGNSTFYKYIIKEYGLYEEV